MTKSKLSSEKALPASQLAPSVSLTHIENCIQNPYPEALPFIGQQRAQTALDFALGMELPGYNVYVMGEAALGRFTMVKDKLDSISLEKSLIHLYVSGACLNYAQVPC